MSWLEIPELPVLRGKEAIKALHDFIVELEKQKDEELTEKKTNALIKLAKGLISSIEAEKGAVNSGGRVKEIWFEMAPVHLPFHWTIPPIPY